MKYLMSCLLLCYTFLSHQSIAVQNIETVQDDNNIIININMQSLHKTK